MDWHLIWSLIQACVLMTIVSFVVTTTLFIATGGEGLAGRKRGKK